MSGSLRHGSRIGAVALATLALVLASGVPAGAVPGVDPPSVATNLPPGGSTTVTKAVETPPVGSSVLDVYFLADTTGSMGGSLADVQAGITDILAAVDTGATDVRFGAGDYKDFNCDATPFNSAAPIPATDDDGAAATAAVAAWSASGGCDTPEAGLFALEAVAGGAAGFRAGAQPVIVWFGDAPSHDPICASVTGEAADVTEATATAALQAAGATVIAVSTTSGPGLDANPGTAGYTGCPGTGSAGQAGRITAATGGLAFSDVDPDGVVDAILSGLSSLPVTVEPSATCDPGLSLAFDAPSKTVTGGDVATFAETATASPTATVGSTLSCTVDWLLNGTPAGPAFVQTLNVTIGGTAPTGVVVKLNGRPHCADHRSAVRTRLVVKPRSSTSVVSVDSSAMRVTNVSKAPNSWVVHLKSTTGSSIPAHPATVVVRTAGGDQSFTVDVPAFTCV
jgi:hypothetical protein